MLIRLPGRLKTPVTMLITVRTIVMSRAHDFPDQSPHVMIKPSTASMTNARPMPMRIVVVNVISWTLVNVDAQGICSSASANSASGIRSQPPAASKKLTPISAMPASKLTKLTNPSKIASSITPPGRDRCWIGCEAIGLRGDAGVEAGTGAPHEGQNALSACNTAPHFTQYDTYSTYIQYYWLNI